MANTRTSKILGTAFNLIVGRDKKRHAHGDPTREVFETVVFVVVLVLMLKLFVAEAFVIPTGSMASTLWGDQVKVECPECGQEFPISAAVSSGSRKVPRETSCQNCGNSFDPKNATDWNSGDRVLVGKYEYHIRGPQRFDVPVFRFPEFPYSKTELSAMNYIKRLVGLPGETIAIYKGDLYRATDVKYLNRKQRDRDEDLWRLRWPTPLDPAENEPGIKEFPRDEMVYIPSRDYTYTNAQEALDLFQQGGFEPIRKEPSEILAMRRLVFDLDKQPNSLQGALRTRWYPAPEAGTGWENIDRGFKHSGEATGWLRYQHVAPGWRVLNNPPLQPADILDHLAYNSPSVGTYWVPDLMIDCKAEFGSTTDRLTLELTKAGDKFQAVFDAEVCRFYRVRSAEPDKPVLLAEQPTGIKSGRFNLRFANIDSRLTVWVDGRPLNFGAAGDYPPPDREKFDKTSVDKNEPARIGAVGGVTVTKLQLWRDLYYHNNEEYQTGNVETHYVQPGHYFCLGDNSASSADGRSWGLVPERLMLGRAVVVYWPLSRIRVIK